MLQFRTDYASGRKGTFIDEGLRQYMIDIYKFMAAGIALSGLSAMATVKSSVLSSLVFNSGFGYLISIVNLGIALYFFWNQQGITLNRSKALFWIYSLLTGVTISYLALTFTAVSIFRTFFITASVFGAVSIYGYTTKSDLTSYRTFFLMGIIGLIISSIVNIFLGSSMLHFIISFVGVVVFTGLIAYDTQRLKAIYYHTGGGEMGQRMAIVGAFTLYLNFINLFFYLIQFLGERR